MDSIERTRNLKLPLLVPNQSGKEFTHNEALIIIDNVMHNAVIDILSTPPEELNVGNKYVVGANASGAFQNKENHIAIYEENGWIFTEINDSYFTWVTNRGNFYTFKDGTWKKLDIYDKRIEAREPKIDEILKYDGSDFVNSSSLTNIKELSVAGDIIAKNANNLDKIRLKVDGGTSNISVSNNNENWLNCISINNSTGKINLEKDVTINGSPISTIEIKQDYKISSNIASLEFTGVEDGREHVFIMCDLQSNAVQELLYCQLGYNTSYSTSDYYWTSQLYSSSSGSCVTQRANGWNCYLLSSYGYGESGIKTTCQTNVELHIFPTNSVRFYLEAKVLTTDNNSIFHTVRTTCMYCKNPKANKIRFCLENGAYFRNGKVKHYVIK